MKVIDSFVDAIIIICIAAIGFIYIYTLNPDATNSWHANRCHERWKESGYISKYENHDAGCLVSFDNGKTWYPQSNIFLRTNENF